VTPITAGTLKQWVINAESPRQSEVMKRIAAGAGESRGGAGDESAVAEAGGVHAAHMDLQAELEQHIIGEHVLEEIHKARTLLSLPSNDTHAHIRIRTHS
jgi:hypothetical protein